MSSTPHAPTRPRTFKEWKRAWANNLITLRIELLKEEAELTLKGLKPTLVLIGPAGIGKTKLVRDALAAAGFPNLIPFQPKSWEELARQYDRCSRDGTPLWVDEAKEVIKNKDMVERVLKLAGDPTGPRCVELEVKTEFIDYSRSDTGRRDWNKEMTPHYLHAAAFYNLNMNRTEMERAIPEALHSRWNIIELPDDRELLWEYIMGLCLTQNLIKWTHLPVLDERGAPVRDELGKPTMIQMIVPRDVQNYTLDFFTRNIWGLKSSPSIRTLFEILNDVMMCTTTKRDVDGKKQHIIDSERLAIRLGKYVWDKPNPAMAHLPVPVSPVIFDWKIVDGLAEEVDEFDAAPAPEVADLLPQITADARKLLLKLHVNGTNPEGLQKALRRHGVAAEPAAVAELVARLVAETAGAA